MHVRRLVLAALVVGLAAPVAPAVAATRKPPCYQITDDAGDGNVGLAKSETLDVLSADISSGPKEVTGILRLKSTAVENDNVLKLGGSWNLNFTVNKVKYSFYANWNGIYGGTTPALTGGMTAGNNKSNPPATFQRKGNNFLWTVPRAAIDGLKKPKTYLYPTNANSGALQQGGDSAFSKVNTKYLDKSPSCLPSK